MPVNCLKCLVTKESHGTLQTLSFASFPFSCFLKVFLRLLLCFCLEIKSHLFLKFCECIELIFFAHAITKGRMDLRHALTTLAWLTYSHFPRGTQRWWHTNFFCKLFNSRDCVHAHHHFLLSIPIFKKLRDI